MRSIHGAGRTEPAPSARTHGPYRPRLLRLLPALMLVCVLASAWGCGVNEGGPADGTRAATHTVTTVTPNPDGSTPFLTPIPSPGATGVETVTEAPQVTEVPSGLKLAGYVIYVDAGHQDKGITEKEPCAPWGPDANPDINNTVMKAKATSGTEGVSTGKAEYAVNLEIALKLRDALEALGATVVMARTTNDSRISNRERALLANEAKADITFNIHCNGASSESVTGIELYVRGKGDNTAEYKQRSDNELALAQKLMDRLGASTGAKKRSVNKSDSYTGINWRDHPTFIVECGFMSNPEEDVKLSTPEYQDKIVAGIVEFVCEDFHK